MSSLPSARIQGLKTSLLDTEARDLNRESRARYDLAVTPNLTSWNRPFHVYRYKLNL